MSNPLLGEWKTAFGLPPFGQIVDADFAPAFDVALAEARARTGGRAAMPSSITADVSSANERFASLLASTSRKSACSAATAATR